MNKIQGKITVEPKIIGSIKASMPSPELEDLEVTPSREEQHLKSKDFYGYNEVIVKAVNNTVDSNIVAKNIKKDIEILGVKGNVVELQGDTVKVSPSTSAQKIVPESPANGFTEVSVNPVTSDIDSNIVPENIKKDVEILGVEGSVVELQGDVLTVYPSITEQKIIPESPINGFTEVNVNAVTADIDSNIVSGNIAKGVEILGVEGNVVELQGDTLTVSPSTSAQQIIPESPVNGFTEVKVNPVTSDIDSNIVPENIAKGVEILGVTGELIGKSEMNLFVSETQVYANKGIWIRGKYEVENVMAGKGIFSTGTWTRNMQQLPYGGYYFGTVAVDRYIYLFGLGSSYTDAYKYDTFEDRYIPITDVPFAFRFGSCSIVGTNIYLFGGSTNPTTAYKYDISTDTYTQITNIPYDFKYGRCVSVGNYIYLVGSSATDAIRYLYRYSVSSNSYSYMGELPYDFKYGGCTVYGTDIYLFGSGTSTYYTTAYKYDTTTKLFTQLRDVPYSFYYGNAISVGTNIYLFGGSGGNTKAYRYVPSLNEYYTVTNISSASVGSGIAFDGRKIYLFGTQQSLNQANAKTAQALEITHSSDIPNKTAVIVQDMYSKTINELIKDSIPNLKTYCNNVYYKDEEGRLITPVVYYGNNGSWSS